MVLYNKYLVIAYKNLYNGKPFDFVSYSRAKKYHWRLHIGLHDGQWTLFSNNLSEGELVAPLNVYVYFTS